MKKIYIIIFIAIILLIITTKKVVDKKLPLGLRLNNPGNITKTTGLWQGEVVSSHKRFKQFINLAYGYRAIFIVLRSYIDKGYDTIEKIITRYAPPSENDTLSYIKNVSKRTGIPSNKKVSFFNISEIKKIVAAIVKSEVGITANVDDINEGYNLL